MTAAEKGSGYIEVGLKIADELLRLGEHAGIPLVGSVCAAARRVLAVLKAANKVVADAVEVGKRVVDVLELLELMSKNVSRMQAAGGIASVEARMRDLATLLGDVEKVVVTFGQKGWLRHALKLRKHSKHLGKLDAEITTQLGTLMKFYQLASDADVQRRLAVREYPVEAEVERQVNQRLEAGESTEPEALEADPEVVRGVAVASGLSAAEFSSELSALSSEVREGFGAHGLKLDEIKKMNQLIIEQMSQLQTQHEPSSSRLDQYTYEPTPGAPPGKKGKAAAKLGGGTFGVTYRMCKKDQSLDARRYAVKFIEDKGEQLETLQKEARLLSLLNHTHVVQQFDAFWHEAKVMEDDEVVMVKQFVIVMELLSGGSLKAKIVEPPPPAAETAEWMRQVASAVAYIHTLNIQHRDLKPDNVMLDESGRAHIIDFGLACKASASRSLARTTRVGTDAYSSPEKDNSEHYGPADDVWAIGCMLAELLLGRPIGTVSRSPDKLKRAIKDSQVASKQLGSWVEGCLQMEPRRRPTAQEIETSILEAEQDFVATYRCIAFREPKLIQEDLPNAEIVKNLLEYGQAQSAEKDLPGWLTNLRVQIGKTKVFMRDHVLKHLEAPKNEVHGGAALVIQTAQRRHAVMRSMGAVNFHKGAIKEINAALKAGDGKVASEKLEELQKRWQGMTLDESTTMVQRMRQQLEEVTQDVADLKDRVKIVFESGDRYEGAWRNENMNGKGTFYYAADGSFYEGQWVEGNKHGEGSHTWVDGQVYKGQWVDDTMHGRGKYVWANGDTYEGQYEAGVRHGKGKFTYANGGVYTGGFANGKKNGFGTYVDPAGKVVYEGEWQDKEHGFGKFVFPNGAVYEGEFVKGKKEGKAKYSDPSGAIYEGSFVAGKRKGYGTYTDPNGAVAYQGEWKDGQPANS